MSTNAADSVHRHNLILLGLNLVAMPVYLLCASAGWYVPAYDLPGQHTITAEPFIWAVSIFPVVILVFMTDLTWAALLITRKPWQRERSWLLSTALWIVTFAIDFSHH